MPRPRRHTCASCYRTFESAAFYGADRTYCCASCASRHLCTCLIEVDLADDGVDGLSLPFASEPVERIDSARVAVR
jgi:hypothetical protein